MPRPLKKSHYSKQKITQELLDQIAETFGEGILSPLQNHPLW